MSNENNYICHHGIKGQKWGVRRFQNEDGTLTQEGLNRYQNDPEYRKFLKDTASKHIPTLFNGSKKMSENYISRLKRDADKAYRKDKELRSLIEEYNINEKNLYKKYKDTEVKVNNKRLILIPEEDENKQKDLKNKIVSKRIENASKVMEKYFERSVSSFNKKITEEGKLFIRKLLIEDNKNKNL